jgi:hypothetical protein
MPALPTYALVFSAACIVYRCKVSRDTLSAWNCRLWQYMTADVQAKQHPRVWCCLQNLPSPWTLTCLHHITTVMQPGTAALQISAIVPLPVRSYQSHCCTAAVKHFHTAVPGRHVYQLTLRVCTNPSSGTTAGGRHVACNCS